MRAGLDVMLFSDNVPLATEVSLKRLARERGRFLMGPDCGTAIINGVPLGFANAVPRGVIGIAAASGTGLQEVACLIAAGGEGISHAIGVGGRDLSEPVGGLMMESALVALAADALTEVICIVGKPPGAGVLERLARWASRTGKPCVAHFPGTDIPTDVTAPAPWRVAPHPRPWLAPAATLEDAAHAAIAVARGARRWRWSSTGPRPRCAGSPTASRQGWGSANASFVACTPAAPWPGKR